MSLKQFHIVLLACMIWNFSYTQEYTRYGIKDGLPSNHVYKIVQDAKGFIWTITDNGIVRFNGSEFKEFTTKDGLPTNDIWEIATTPDGKVWFFCKAARIGYIDNTTIHTFEAAEEGVIFFPYKIAEMENQVFFESGNKWYFLNESKKWQGVEAGDTLFSENLNIKHLLNIQAKMKADLGGERLIYFRQKDSLGLWVTNNSYSVYNDKTGALSKKILNSDGRKKGFSPYARINLYQGRIQITDTNYLATLGAEYNLDREYFIKDEINSHQSTLDTIGNLWIATFGEGMYKLPATNGKIEYFLKQNRVSSIYELEPGRIMASVFGKGFYEYDVLSADFLPYLQQQEFSYSANWIDSLKSTFFIDRHKIMRESRDKNGLILTKDVIIVAEGIKEFEYHNGYLWGFGSFDLKRLHPNTLEIVSKYPSVGINKLLAFKGELYLGTTDGLKSLQKSAVGAVMVKAPVYQKPVLNLVPLDRDWMIVCTDGFGAYATNLKAEINFPGSEYLSITDAYVDGREIWLASNNGLMRYSFHNKEIVLIDTFSEDQGMPTRKINGVAVQNNAIMVATDDGIAVFDKDINFPSQFLDIYIETVNYSGQPLESDTPAVAYQSDNTIEFRVSTIDFADKANLTSYQYRLLPVQKEWITTNSSILNFSGLQPTEYTLQFGANDKQKSFSFVVTPLWWQRTDIRMLLLLMFIGMLGFILYKYRRHEIAKKTAKLETQKKLAEFELYALRSQMNPHFVFNSLAAIQYCINNNEIAASEAYLVKFSKLVRQFFEISKEKEVTVETEVNLLRNYLDIEKLRFKEKLDYRISVDPQIDTKAQKIPTMLLQPIVENAVNHGIFNKETRGTINIEIENYEAGLKIDIADNGVGFVNSKKKSLNGRNSSDVMNDRLLFLNRSGSWDISMTNREMYPTEGDRGNVTTFIIKQNR